MRIRAARSPRSTAKTLAVFISSVALAGAGLIGCATAPPPPPKPTVALEQPTFTSIVPDGEATSYPSTWDASFTLHWAVSAPAGVCSQTMTYQDYDTLGGDTDPILGYATQTDPLPASARSYSGGDGYWLDFLRGGYNVVIRVTDCHGVQVASNPVHVVLQPGDDQDAAMTYSAGWKVANCPCFPGGTSHYTSTKYASVSFRTATPIDASGVQLALIMPKGPGRGSADLYIDGVWKATINTYQAGANVNGTIVYQTLLAGTASHVIRLVNLATAGHPRIDLDATINGG